MGPERQLGETVSSQHPCIPVAGPSICPHPFLLVTMEV